MEELYMAILDFYIIYCHFKISWILLHFYVYLFSYGFYL